MAGTVDVVTPADREGTEAVVLRWFKRVGDTVNQHEPLLELETDKVTVEVAAPASGTLLEVLRKETEVGRARSNSRAHCPRPGSQPSMLPPRRPPPPRPGRKQQMKDC